MSGSGTFETARNFRRYRSISGPSRHGENDVFDPIPMMVLVCGKFISLNSSPEQSNRRPLCFRMGNSNEATRIRSYVIRGRKTNGVASPEHFSPDNSSRSDGRERENTADRRVIVGAAYSHATDANVSFNDMIVTFCIGFLHQTSTRKVVSVASTARRPPDGSGDRPDPNYEVSHGSG